MAHYSKLVPARLYSFAGTNLLREPPGLRQIIRGESLSNSCPVGRILEVYVSLRPRREEMRGPEELPGYDSHQVRCGYLQNEPKNEIWLAL
jgi:hypothetical protein